MSGVPEQSDAELLAATTAGGRAAFEALYRRYRPWLATWLRYRCPDAAVVDDAVQDTFLAVWRGSARYRAPAKSLLRVNLRSTRHERRVRDSGHVSKGAFGALNDLNAPFRASVMSRTRLSGHQAKP